MGAPRSLQLKMHGANKPQGFCQWGTGVDQNVCTGLQGDREGGRNVRRMMLLVLVVVVVVVLVLVLVVVVVNDTDTFRKMIRILLLILLNHDLCFHSFIHSFIHSIPKPPSATTNIALLPPFSTTPTRHTPAKISGGQPCHHYPLGGSTGHQAVAPQSSLGPWLQYS